MQVLIMFFLQTDLMNHFILSEFTGVFLFVHNYKAVILPISKFLTLSYYFFCILGPITVIVPGDYCFYVYCVNEFYRKKKG